MIRTKDGESLKEDLSNYDASMYERPSVTVDICICSPIGSTFKILLIKRRKPPFKDHWAIPGGFLDLTLNETLEEAARRELHEETSLEGFPVEQFKTYGHPNRDPRTRVVSVVYFAVIPWSEVQGKVEAKDDAKEAEWFNFNDLPELAFDHSTILKDLLESMLDPYVSHMGSDSVQPMPGQGKIEIEIECGEKTCAREPGKFCRYFGTVGLGQKPVCRLFPTEKASYTHLDEVGGWTMRCDDCIAYSKQVRSE
jgi:ADP-ribose pyrophosphatase YjhB (NUDIX family)